MWRLMHSQVQPLAGKMDYGVDPQIWIIPDEVLIERLKKVRRLVLALKPLLKQKKKPVLRLYL